MTSPSSHMEEAVRFVIDRALYTTGRTRADLARAMGITNSTLKRRMEGAGAGGALDALVSATSGIVGTPPINIWSDALRLWERAPAGDRYWRELHRKRADLVAASGRHQASATDALMVELEQALETARVERAPS